MRKLFLLSTTVLALVAGTAQAQDYQQATRDAQRQAWENAGMGIAIDAAGAIVGAVVGSVVKPAPQAGAPAPQPGYAPAPPAPPAVVNPYYYPKAQACVTQRAPVFDSYGRVVEFVQYCANTPR